MSINVASSDRGWGVISKMHNAMELPLCWDAGRLGVVTCYGIYKFIEWI